ncbi:MAG: molybdopterin-binding protein [Methanomethylovorans sp.]|uniref:TOBE domain-containing protein n=1 Tax=Methanomethylovorans sp. TaxID=2758717 RepID=UPI003530B766
MKISARNVLKGKVKHIKAGNVTAEVTIDLGNGIEIVSVITKTAPKSLVVKVGNEIYAFIKASSITLTTD